VQGAVANGRRLLSLFSTTDEGFHAKHRRCVNNAFAMSSLVNYEPLVTSTLTYWLDRTEELYASTDQSCNFSQWLQFFAFDVIGEITWSKRLGFVEGNTDVDNIISFLRRFSTMSRPSGKCRYSIVFFGRIPLSSSHNASASTSACTPSLSSP